MSILVEMPIYQNSGIPNAVPKRLELEQWHLMHCKSQPPVNAYPEFGGPWKEWLPRLAWQFRPSRGLNPDLIKGWYDRARVMIVRFDVPLRTPTS
jgi:hypothetical protein